MIAKRKLTGLEIIILLLLLAMPLLDTIYPSALEGASRIVPVIIKTGIVLVLSFYFFAKRKNWWFRIPIAKTITAFILIHLAYLVFSSDNYFTDIYKVSKTLIWYLGFFFFLELGALQKLSQKQINWFFTFVILFLFLMVFRETTVAALFKKNRDYGASNYAYFLLFAMPFMFMDKKIPFRILLFGIISLGVAISLKRGTMLLYSAFVIYLVFFSNLREISGKWFNRIFKFAIVLIIGLVLNEVVFSNEDLYINKFSDLTEESIADKGVYSVGSGRGALYLLPLERWITSNPFNFILGYGFNATPDFYPTTGIFSKSFYAHSDFVMLIHDYGMIGVLFLWFFFRRLYKEAKNSIVITDRIPLFLLFIALLIKAVFSGFILYDYSIYAFALLGLIIGRKITYDYK